MRERKWKKKEERKIKSKRKNYWSPFNQKSASPYIFSIPIVVCGRKFQLACSQCVFLPFSQNFHCTKVDVNYKLNLLSFIILCTKKLNWKPRADFADIFSLSRRGGQKNQMFFCNLSNSTHIRPFNVLPLATRHWLALLARHSQFRTCVSRICNSKSCQHSAHTDAASRRLGLSFWTTQCIPTSRQNLTI